MVLDSNVQVVDVELSTIDNFSGATHLVRHGGANAQDLFSASGALSALTEGGITSWWVGVTVGSVTTSSGGTLVLRASTPVPPTPVERGDAADRLRQQQRAPPDAVHTDRLSSAMATAVRWGSGGALERHGQRTPRTSPAINDALRNTPGYSFNE